MAKKQRKDNPEKSKLIALSVEARATREKLIAKANNRIEMLAASALTINDILITQYQKDSGAKAFNTYLGWADIGYQVKKGEKAVRIWGKPRRATPKNNNQDKNQPKGTQTLSELEDEYKYWPMCCLFSDHQVELVDTDTVQESQPTTIKDTSPKPANNEQAPSPVNGAADTKTASKLG